MLSQQKSRNDWIIHGDRNIALTRRRKNRIVANENGQWLHDVEAIKRHSMQFFSKLYKEENSNPQPYLIRGPFL